ncbi:MAG TPA: TonB-dependent receptor [Burkholderiaceae bacterium]|nr:TonB-dependent receptor [Burkholderiaceae bacterium]
MHPTTRRLAALAALAALSTGSALAQAQGAGTHQVEVIGTSPLPGLGVDRDLLPYGTLTVRRPAIDAAQTANTTDLLARRLPGMKVNDIQGSPYQGDLTYRGYRASGLLGAPQGLSVYLDGVRINEPFGDVVLWDLVPEFSLQSISVVPGANPAFGLNTLGGAIVLTTADGRSAPGARVELGGGSFGRKRLDASYGHSDATSGWHQYTAASAFDERGWRDESPGNLGNVLARIGRSEGASAWDVSLLAARSTLIGNGLVPQFTFDDEGNRTPDLAENRYQAVYTHPDRTRNELGQLAFNWSRQIDDASRLQALAYVRSTRRDTTNGDVADEPGEIASLNTTQTKQTAYGVAVSLARHSGDHRWQMGASVDANRVKYRQSEQEGEFDASRGVLPEPGAEPALSAAVDGDAVSLGLYATDTWRVAGRTHVTGTVRANRSRVGNQLTSLDDNTGALDVQPRETFTYTSLNPALGVTQGLGHEASVFANLARNTRVPTAMELGCANPNEPCRLPAGLQSDPYLDQVRSTSFELGARWRPAAGHRLELTLYRTDNRDDIVFGSASTTGQLGYFQNFPKTRHQGGDLSWQGTLGALSLDASASVLKATYEADGTLRMGERNVIVAPGTRIAGVPKNMLKIAADWRFAAGWSVGADVQRTGRRVVQGNEDGLIEDGGTERVDFTLPGYTETNLRLSWRPAPMIELLARVNNVFDKRYASYGAIAETVFDAQGNYTGTEADALFVAPGTPRNWWIDLRLSF